MLAILPPTHVFFDLGDTLVDLRPLVSAMADTVRSRLHKLEESADAIGRAWVLLTAQETLEASGEGYRPGLSITASALQRVIRKHGFETSESSSLAMVRAAWVRYLNNATLYPDANLEVLRKLRTLVTVMGIVTDSETSMVSPLLTRLGMAELFDEVVVSDSVGAYKPDPRIFLAAMRRTAGTPSRSIFVSNSLVDLEGARSVGMRAVWINREGITPTRAVPGMQTLKAVRNLPEVLTSRGGQ